MPLFRRKADRPAQLKSECRPPTPATSAEEQRNGFLSSDMEATLGSLPPPSPPRLQLAEEEYDPRLCMRTKSRLSKTLEDVLSDSAAVAYFIQFMEENGTKALVKFWMEARSFHSSCLLRSATLEWTKGRTMESDEEIFKDSTADHEDNEKSSGDCAIADRRSTATACTDHPLIAPLEGDAAEQPPKNLLGSRRASTNDAAKTEEVLDDLALRTTATEGNGRSRLENSADVRPPSSRRDSLCRDASHIFSKYVAEDAPLPIGATEELRSRISETISQDHVHPDCFLPAQQFVLKRMEKEVFPAFLRSPYNCKHQVDVLTSGNVSLADILYNDSALFYFMEYMEQEQSRHLVDFLLMADNFRKDLLAQGHYDGLRAQDDAMVIYDKYFSLQATSPLGFSDAVRLEVEQNICREEGPLPNCFEKPVMILMQHLEKYHLKQFLTSQLYVKYISECITTIQTAQSDNDSLRWKKRSGSDSSSSDLSVASQTINNLLAADGKQPGSVGGKRILKNVASNDMKIDTGQFNPDSLWKRSLAGKLQMAYVDHLGKVTTEFEPEPDKKTGSNLTKAFRKLVNWDVDKAEEDLAWQVAEMIVKDVCTVTLNRGSAAEDIG